MLLIASFFFWYNVMTNLPWKHGYFHCQQLGKEGSVWKEQGLQERGNLGLTKKQYLLLKQVFIYFSLVIIYIFQDNSYTSIASRAEPHRAFWNSMCVKVSILPCPRVINFLMTKAMITCHKVIIRPTNYLNIAQQITAPIDIDLMQRCKAARHYLIGVPHRLKQ
jgi:hypothetical protein